jgi:hypothetical protein
MRTGALLFLAMVSGGLPASVDAADAIHIQQLQAIKDQWTIMAADERRISLEGRFAGRAGRLLRLLNSDLVFRVEEGVRLPKLKSGRNVEIIGYLRSRDNKIDFVVQRIADGGSDLDRLVEDRKALPLNDAKAWYGLAAWAEKRAAFYDDGDLLNESRLIVVAAFEIERRAIKKGDGKSLRALADRVETLGLETSLRTQMIHESLRWQWQALTLNRKVTTKERQEFLKVLEKELKGCKQPIRLASPNLLRNYNRNPKKTYDAATLSNQLLLHRYFYREVLKPLLLVNARADGSNGRAIAKELRSRIPEEAELAAKYDAAELQFRIRSVESMTRSEMLDLVDQLERINRRKVADDTKRRWVVASEKRLVTRGPAGLVQAANEYDALLGDKNKAIRLLKQAWQESSEKAEIEERLKRYDLYRGEETWLSKEQVDLLPENQMDQALREGRVIKGMTVDQVRKTLGEPDRISRFASQRRVQIVWSFIDASSSRISVVFERKVSDAKTNAPKVILVTTLPSK